MVVTRELEKQKALSTKLKYLRSKIIKRFWGMDEMEEPRASTSKQDQEKRSHKSNSNSDVEKQDDRGSSETSVSNTHSENSRMEMGRPKVPTGGKKERKLKTRKNRSKPAGRVVKRTRRQEIKRPERRRRSKRLRDHKKKRQLSISTIFTRLSSSASMTQGCPHCGHRCCRRRYYERMRMRRLRNFSKKEKLHFKCMATQTSGSECIQAGSRCLMLSPLCLNTNASPPEPIPDETTGSGIKPEMIYEALTKLSMWRQDVRTDAILDYIKRTYPVGCGEGLLAELTEKLQIAVMVGIVMHTGEDIWCLSTALQQRKITKNHITLFWKIYADTMKPVGKKPNSPKEKAQKTDQESNTEVDRENEILPNLTYDFI